MLKLGDVILVKIQFTDTFEIKKRPAVVLFEEFDNVIVAGITSNFNIRGIKIKKKDGAIKDSVIKLNYIFTISTSMIKKKLFSLPNNKKKEIFNKLNKKIDRI